MIDERWKHNFKLLVLYYNHYGNIDVPNNFRTKDGINYCVDPGSVFLGKWFNAQKILYIKGTLSVNKAKLLDKLNIKLSIKEKEEKSSKKDNKKMLNLKWDEYYGLAKNYYCHYGNLNILSNFNTFDGITKVDDENAYRLGEWLIYQKVLYKKNKLPYDKIIKLDSIRIVWDKSKNKQLIINFLETCNVKYNTNDYNKNIINTISYQELFSKYWLLIRNKMPIVDEEGNFNQVFNMTSDKLYEMFNVSLEYILRKYYYNSIVNKQIV